MTLQQTPEINQNWEAKNFNLLGIDYKWYHLGINHNNNLPQISQNCIGKNGIVIVFMCNHCPYIKSSIDRIEYEAKALRELNIGFVGINSNDYSTYPDDSPLMMLEFSKKHNLTFPYLIDDTQEVAKAYGAVCTPDFFGFDSNLKLQYRGRLDSFREKIIAPEQRQQHDRELYNAMLDVIRNGKPAKAQLPSIGCSIKWR